jgi:hypothetical protein
MEVTVLGQSLREIRRWITEQFPDVETDPSAKSFYTFSAYELITIELLREMHCSIVGIEDRTRELTAAVDRMNVKLTKCLNTLKPRHRGR